VCVCVWAGAWGREEVGEGVHPVKFVPSRHVIRCVRMLSEADES